MSPFRNITTFIKGVNFINSKMKIDNSGEQIVTDYLSNKGFKVHPVETGHHVKSFEVNGQPSNFLVQVKSAIKPKTPLFASIEEENNLKTEAEKLGYEAWEARVQMDRKLQPVGEIKWRKLN